MPQYDKTTWVNDSAPAIDATNLNKIEQGIADALPKDGSNAMTGQLKTISGSAATPAIAPTGDSDTGILFPAAGRISLTSNGTEVVYCHSNLNVAVGHNAPTSKLDVAGTIAARGAASAGAFFTISPDATTGTNGTTLSNSFASGGYGPLYIQNGGSTRMTVLSGGNVGIGNTNPPELLTLSNGGLTIFGTNSSINYDGISMDFNSTSREGRIAVGGTSGQNGFLTFTTSNAGSEGERMRITAGGDVNFKANLTFDSSALITGNATYDLRLGSNGTSRVTIESGGTTRPTLNNTYELGSATYRWSTIYAQNALNTSDARLKTDVQESSLGLDFISSLNPVQFRYIEGGNTVSKDEEGNEVVTPREGIRTHFGLLAQEVKAALPQGLDFAGWALADKDDADSTQFLGYMELIAPMIKAIKELNAKVEALEAQIK